MREMAAYQTYCDYCKRIGNKGVLTFEQWRKVTGRISDVNYQFPAYHVPAPNHGWQLVPGLGL